MTQSHHRERWRRKDPSHHGSYVITGRQCHHREAALSPKIWKFCRAGSRRSQMTRIFMRLAGPVLVAVSVLVAAVHLRLEPVRRRSERGASAVEWAVIAGITVAAAVAIGTVVWQKVNTSKDLINTELPTGG